MSAPDAGTSPTTPATVPDQPPSTGPRRVLVTVGWTRPDREAGYSAFLDGWRPGADQHTETLTFLVPADYSDLDVVEALFVATNDPDTPAAGTVPAGVRAALDATGYNGAGAHYSLSVGDTVSIHTSEAGPDGPTIRYTYDPIGVREVERT